MAIWKYSIIEATSPGTEDIFTATANGTTITSTATQIRIAGGSPAVGLLTGTGITKTGGDVDGGTITGFTVKASGTLVLQATGLNISAEAAFSRLDAHDSFGFAQLMFSGKDQITGTSMGEDLYGFARSDVITALGGKDELYGGAGADSLFGGLGKDSLHGEGGNDLLDGGGSVDGLEGGLGNDILKGGLGKDEMMGGVGADRFVFDTAVGEANSDLIGDFEHGVDKIVLDRSIYAALAGPGTLAAGRFVIGTDAADANDRIIFDNATHTLWYDRDGTGAAAKQQIAAFSVTATLSASDFLIIA